LASLTRTLCRNGNWREAIKLNPWSRIGSSVESIECYCAVATASVQEDPDQAMRYMIRALIVSCEHLDPHDLSITDNDIRRALAEVASQCPKYSMVRRLLQPAQDAGLLEVCLMAFLTQSRSLDRFSLRRLLRWMPLKHDLLSAWLAKVEPILTEE
jgi:hypothetical protein